MRGKDCCRLVHRGVAWQDQDLQQSRWRGLLVARNVRMSEDEIGVKSEAGGRRKEHPGRM